MCIYIIHTYTYTHVHTYIHILISRSKKKILSKVFEKQIQVNSFHLTVISIYKNYQSLYTIDEKIEKYVLSG